MTVWGNHSASQYPDLVHAEVDGASAAAAVGDQAWIEDEFIPTVAKRGAAIIDARGASGGLRRQRRDRPRPRLGPRHPRRRLGLDGGPSDGSYGVPEGVVSGFPCTCSGGEYEIVTGLEIDDFSRERSTRGRRARGRARERSRSSASSGAASRAAYPLAPRLRQDGGVARGPSFDLAFLRRSAITR